MVAGHEVATALDQDSSSTSRQSRQGKSRLKLDITVHHEMCLEIWCTALSCTLISGYHVISFHCCVGGVSDNDSEAYASLVQHQRTLLSAESSGPGGSEADLAEDTLCSANVNESDPGAVVLHETCTDEIGPRHRSGLDGSSIAQPKQLQSCRAKLRVKQKRTKHRSGLKHQHASA